MDKKSSLWSFYLRRSFAPAAALVALFLLCSTVAFPEPPAAPRVVAIGDVHGDFDAFAALLQHNGLVDSNLKWTGDDTTLVQTGDLLDRGKKARTVMDLLMALEKDAPRKKGRVIVLLGNHEMMNITGDLRYAEPMFASFMDSGSEGRRKKAWAAYVEWQKSRAEALKKPEPAITEELQAAWMAAHPLGFFEHREAMGPAGKYGRWLRARPGVARVGETIFAHGGISPEIASAPLEAIEQRMRDEVRAWDALVQFLSEQKIILPFFTINEMTAAAQEEMEFRQRAIAERQAAAAQAGKTYQPDDAEKKYIETLQRFLSYPGWYSINPSGPLWFRGYAQWSEEEGEPQVARLLAGFGAARLVVGHTPQKDGRIAKRFGGKVFLIDTGMLSSYYAGGRAAALEIAQNKISAVYMDSRVVLQEFGAGASQPAAGEQAGEDIPGGGVQEKQPAPAPAQAAQPATPQPAPPHSSAEPAAHTGNTPRPAHVWVGAESKPLPFQTDEQIMEFLNTAKIVSKKTVGVGITSIEKFALEKDGIHMNAAFRAHDEEKDIARMANGQMEMGFRDTYIFENAAYELARILGLDTVPPVVLRSYAGRRGSLQIWLEDTMMESERQKKKIRPPDPKRWNQQVQILRVFDNLIYNTDRNMGNILIDKDWKLWMIDHTRAFRRYDQLNNANAIVQCERSLWTRLQQLNEGEVRQRLKPYLRGAEIDALLKRRIKIIERINALIAEKGEDAVLFKLN